MLFKDCAFQVYLSGEMNRARQRQNSAIIVADGRRFAHVDGVLGTHKCVGHRPFVVNVSAERSKFRIVSTKQLVTPGPAALTRSEQKYHERGDAERRVGPESRFRRTRRRCPLSLGCHCSRSQPFVSSYKLGAMSSFSSPNISSDRFLRTRYRTTR
jgi:hypothetical protein